MSGMHIVCEQPERSVASGLYLYKEEESTSWGFVRIDREFAVSETVWGYERLGEVR
jgi:hypothetical protein